MHGGGGIAHPETVCARGRCALISPPYHSDPNEEPQMLPAPLLTRLTALGAAVAITLAPIPAHSPGRIEGYVKDNARFSPGPAISPSTSTARRSPAHRSS